MLGNEVVSWDYQYDCGSEQLIRRPHGAERERESVPAEMSAESMREQTVTASEKIQTKIGTYLHKMPGA